MAGRAAGTRGEWYSDETLLDSLRAAARLHGDPLAADAYDRFSAATGAVTSVRVIQRFGSWNAACTAAGLRTNPGRPSYARRWTPEEMARHVADYLGEDGSAGTYAGYNGYARRTVGAPSAQTVRNTFGSWSEAKRAAGAAAADD